MCAAALQQTGRVLFGSPTDAAPIGRDKGFDMSLANRPFRRLALNFASFAVVGLALAACATPPPASDPDAVAEFRETNDPLEPTNRVFYKVNDALDMYAIRPVAVAYVWAVPRPARNGVHNVLNNLGSTTVLVNDIAEGNPKRAAITLWRFTVNSLLGVGGLFDIAKSLGLAGHDADFNTTLGVWGIPSGPFLFLPVLGPSSPRAVVGFGGDMAADPFTWTPNGQGLATLGYAKFGLGVLDTRASLLTDLDRIKASALDPYATLRSLYRQNAQSGIDAARGDTP